MTNLCSCRWIWLDLRLQVHPQHAYLYWSSYYLHMLENIYRAHCKPTLRIRKSQLYFVVSIQYVRGCIVGCSLVGWFIILSISTCGCVRVSIKLNRKLWYEQQINANTDDYPKVKLNDSHQSGWWIPFPTILITMYELYAKPHQFKGLVYEMTAIGWHIRTQREIREIYCGIKI